MDIRVAIQKNAVMTVFALCAGLAGSALHGWMNTNPETIRATRFEVVDPSGTLLSFWGPDNDPRIHASTPKGTLLVFMNAKGQRGCELGSRTGDKGPTLNFYDRDSRERVTLALSGGDDPFLGFSSSRIEGTVMLGTIKGDVADDKPGDSWGLRLRSGNAWSSIAAYESLDGKHGAGVHVRDEEGRYWNFPPDPKAH
jgi:hypothetical protein